MTFDLFNNSTVEIETSISPPVRVNLGSSLVDGGDGPGLLTRLLRPRVTIRTGDVIVARVEPSGAPDPVARKLFAVLVALAIIYFALRITK